MSQMSHVSHTSESHVRESIELGSNMLPVRDETRGSSLEVSCPHIMFSAIMS